jgi:phosphoribosyl 1,2-cyclic phosphodiesterase
MARNKRRFDPYRQPGLFDKMPGERDVASGELQVAISGGEMPSSVPPPPLSESPLGELARPNSVSRLKFISFGSGSSGNCAYIGDDRFGVLIDAGVDYAHVMGELRRQGISMDKVRGIILTHDHGDHTRYAYNILRNNRHMALYATPRAFNGMLRRHSISRRIKDYHHPVYKEIAFNVGDFVITPFEVMHDGTDNVGFLISAGGGAFRFVVVTDLGVVSERAHFYMSQATALMLESNYDAAMLRDGHYPEYLKARIAAETGHLDNADAADWLRENYTPQLRHVFLCHLSNDNNTPEIAVAASRQALLDAGAASVGDGSLSLDSRQAPVQLVALPRFDPSPMYIIRY